MTNNQFSISGSRGIEFPAIGRELQARRNPPAFLQLVRSRANRPPLRIALPLMPRPFFTADRAVNAALREAELAAWQASGGDAWRRSQPE